MTKYTLVFETETLKMHRSSKLCSKYWLFDETREMNLAMDAESEREAFIEALEYYQDRLKTVETDYSDLSKKVDSFLDQFRDDEE